MIMWTSTRAHVMVVSRELAVKKVHMATRSLLVSGNGETTGWNYHSWINRCIHSKRIISKHVMQLLYDNDIHFINPMVIHGMEIDNSERAMKISTQFSLTISHFLAKWNYDCPKDIDTIYRQISNIRHTLVGNKVVDHSDSVGASPTTTSLST